MPKFNSSGAMPFGPGNFYGVGTGSYGAPTKIYSYPPRTPSTPQERLNDMHLSCEQWLALPIDQQRYAVYMQERNANPDFDIRNAGPIVQAISILCTGVGTVIAPGVKPSGAVDPMVIRLAGATVVLGGIAALLFWGASKTR